MTESQMNRLATLIARKIFEESERLKKEGPPTYYAVDENGNQYEISEREFLQAQLDDLKAAEQAHVVAEEYKEALEIQKKIQTIKTKLDKL